MADIAGMLDELQHKTAHNPEWKARFLASREEADPNFAGFAENLDMRSMRWI